MTELMMNKNVETELTAEYDTARYAATEAAIEAAALPAPKQRDTLWQAALVIATTIYFTALKIQFIYSTGLVEQLLQLFR